MRDKLQRYQFRLLKKLLVRCSTMSTWSKCSSMQVMWKQKRWLTKTKQQWFNAFREADAITSNISLAILSARDQFWDTVLFSFHQHRICEFWDSWNLDTFFMVLPTWALICDTTTSTVFSFPSLKRPVHVHVARRTLEEREILKERQKCQVCLLYIITHKIEKPGVYEQSDGLRVPSLWPPDDLHLLWPQTCQLSYLQKADCQSHKDIQGLSLAVQTYLQCKYIV